MTLYPTCFALGCSLRLSAGSRAIFGNTCFPVLSPVFLGTSFHCSLALSWQHPADGMLFQGSPGELAVAVLVGAVISDRECSRVEFAPANSCCNSAWDGTMSKFGERRRRYCMSARVKGENIFQKLKKKFLRKYIIESLWFVRRLGFKSWCLTLYVLDRDS